MAVFPSVSPFEYFPPGFTPNIGIAICVAALGLTRAQSVVALELVRVQSPQRVILRLGCAAGTVKSHLSAIIARLGVSNGAGVVGVVVATMWREMDSRPPA